MKPLLEKGYTKFKNELLDKIDLTGLGEWSQNKQKVALELITEYASKFAMSNMDLGKISLVKHSIRLMITPHLKSIIGESHQVYKRKLGNI